MRVLLSWIGDTDLKNANQDRPAALATIACDHDKMFDQVILLDGYGQDRKQDIEHFRPWLEKRLKAVFKHRTKVLHKKVNLVSPIDYHEITILSNEILSQHIKSNDEIYINLTSGTPAMAAVWSILGYGAQGTTLLQSKWIRETDTSQIERVSFPEDFYITYTKAAANRIGTADIDKAFSKITVRSEQMSKIVKKAQRLGRSYLPALILGETGTGKELMAKAIHDASNCVGKFKAVNCGALAENLVESTLFGHKKGSFTGAVTDHDGLFVTANKGSVFLDEVGELSLDAQVKLLRVLNESEVTPVGSSKTDKVDVRIIAATHRNLQEMVAQGTFREDLYYRLAVGVIELPPLRERKDDLEPLIDELLQESIEAAKKHPDFQDTLAKRLSPKAKRWLTAQQWPGNIRELKNTIDRAVLWCESNVIEIDDIAEHMGTKAPAKLPELVVLSPSDEVDLNQIVNDIKDKYCQAALKACGGVKSRAAKMLGFASPHAMDTQIKLSKKK